MIAVRTYFAPAATVFLKAKCFCVLVVTSFAWQLHPTTALHLCKWFYGFVVASCPAQLIHAQQHLLNPVESRWSDYNGQLYFKNQFYRHIAFYRFAQFFLCPLFDESCKDREVNAVDSEHEKNLMNDAWRLFQLEKATGNPSHPFSKFGTGRKTLLL